MSMLSPEKPKRKPRLQSRWRRTIVVGVLIVPIFLSILAQQRLELGQVLDVFLIGFMLCCTLFIVYQVILEILASLTTPDEPGVG